MHTVIVVEIIIITAVVSSKTVGPYSIHSWTLLCPCIIHSIMFYRTWNPNAKTGKEILTPCGRHRVI